MTSGSGPDEQAHVHAPPHPSHRVAPRGFVPPAGSTAPAAVAYCGMKGNCRPGEERKSVILVRGAADRQYTDPRGPIEIANKSPS